MPAIGAHGGNRNFNAVFTVPASQTLVGYLRDTLTGAKYSALDIKATIPAAKVTAVKAALAASSSLYTLLPGNSMPFALGGGKNYKGYRIRWRKGSKTAAEITSLLAAVETAITT